jgi:uncharacterized membrane protein YdjX (TVP38/TMEM64 family)
LSTRKKRPHNLPFLWFLKNLLQPFSMQHSSRKKIPYRFTLFFVLFSVAVALFILQKQDRISSIFFNLKETVSHLDSLRLTISGYGSMGPIVFVFFQVLQVVAAPLPGEATGAAGGYLFGWSIGFLLSTLGLTVGSCLAFGIGHYFRNMVLAKLQGTKAYHRFNHLVCKGDFVLPFLLFLIPGFPKDILCYMMGLSTIPFRVFFFISTIGRIPGTLMLSFQGAQVYQRQYGSFFILLVVSMATALPCYFFRQQILTFLGEHNKKQA